MLESKIQVNKLCFPTCVLLSCLSLQFPLYLLPCYFLYAKAHKDVGKVISSLRFIFCCNIFFICKLSDNCPDGWKEFEGFCYKFDLENEISFSQEVESCRQMNAELLVVNSIEENRFIEGQITSDNYVWLGITLRRGLDASWELLNGKEATFELLRESDTDVYKQYMPYSVRLCAVLARDKYHWIQVECVRGGYANTVCKRPFSG